MALLEVDDVIKHFRIGPTLFGRSGAVVRALDGVSLRVDAGQTVAIVGESGSGKTTLGRLILDLARPDSGTIRFDGRRWDELGRRERRAQRRRVQAVFQDPFSSLSPRMKVKALLAEPLLNFGLADSFAARQRVAALLRQVGLPSDAVECLPHEFSGGQRQRIAIARALAASPELIVCDEAVSALDVSVKAQIVNLLRDLQDELGLALVFISHDLAIVENLAHRVAVMYAGRIVEIADRRELFSRPAHPYTRALLEAVPSLTPGEESGAPRLSGDAPNPLAFPSGCRFHPRCRHAFDRCAVETPALRPLGDGQLAACHLFDGSR